MVSWIRQIAPVVLIMLAVEIGTVLYLHTYCMASSLFEASIVLAFLPFIYLGMVIKRFSKRSWSYSMTLALLLSLAVIAPTSILAPILMEVDCGPFPHYQHTEGWVKLQVLRPSVSYETNGLFNAVFINTEKTPIMITDITILETRKERTPCTDVLVNGRPLRAGEITIRVGEDWKVTARCPVKNDGRPYEIEMGIRYSIVIDGVSADRVEKGAFQGPVGL